MKKQPTYVGIDVAKNRVDIFIRPTGHGWSVNYIEAEVDELVAKLQTIEPTVAIVEATGGLELPLVAALAAASLPVAVVNPRQVRDFAKSTGQLAKNDRLDARILAHLGEAVQPTVRPLRDAEAQALSATLSRRRQIVAMLTAERNRRGRAIPEVCNRIQTHITWLEEELKDLDDELRGIVQSSPV